MKATIKANLQRAFGIIIGIIALFPIGDSIMRSDKVELNIFGFVTLITYLCALFLKKRTFAGWSFCSVAIYFFVIDFTSTPFSFTSLYLVVLLSMSLRFAMEMLILIQGYFGLCTLDEEKAIVNNNDHESHSSDKKTPNPLG